MQSIYLGTFQLHANNTPSLGYAVAIPLTGLEFPEVRRSSYDKPGEHGSYLSNLLYSGRLIQLEGMVYASDVATFEGRRRALESAVRILKDSNGVPTAITLKLTTMDSLALQMDTYIKSLTLKVMNLTNARFLLELYAPDYTLNAQALQTATITRASGGGAVYPIIYPIIYGASSGGSGILINNGDAEAYPLIYLNGPLTNPIIQNLTNGRYVEIDLTLNSTDQIVIDMKNKTVILNGAQSVLGNKNVSSQWWWLEPGSNTIKFFTSNGADTGNAQVQWRDAYLGV